MFDSVGGDHYGQYQVLMGSDSPNSYINPIQIIELGNALAILSGTTSWEQGYKRDNEPNPNPNGFGSNNPPGQDLWNCVTAPKP
jgi:hypothetical protein